MTDLIALAARYRTVAVVGLAKNTGKTVTVNYLIAGANRSGLKLALTSTGRDGETADILSALPKPLIHLPGGALLATAAPSLGRGTARLEILEVTGIANALGEIVIARVREPGTVEVSGPERTEDLRSIIDCLQEHADLVLVDGALDRIAPSAPSVTKGAVLATGAALGGDMKRVVDSTVHTARVLLTPVADLPPGQAAALIESGKTAVQNDKGAVKVLPLFTAIDAPVEILDYLDSEYKRLLVGGAFSDELADLLLGAAGRVPGLEVVVRDGTRIFVEPRRWQRLLRSGAAVKVVEPINLIAITVNPLDPGRKQLPGKELVSALKQLLPELLIFDPLAEGGA